MRVPVSRPPNKKEQRAPRAGGSSSSFVLSSASSLSLLSVLKQAQNHQGRGPSKALGKCQKGEGGASFAARHPAQRSREPRAALGAAPPWPEKKATRLEGVGGGGWVQGPGATRRPAGRGWVGKERTGAGAVGAACSATRAPRRREPLSFPCRPPDGPLVPPRRSSANDLSVWPGRGGTRAHDPFARAR